MVIAYSSSSSSSRLQTDNNNLLEDGKNTRKEKKEGKRIEGNKILNSSEARKKRLFLSNSELPTLLKFYMFMHGQCRFHHDRDESLVGTTNLAANHGFPRRSVAPIRFAPKKGGWRCLSGSLGGVWTWYQWVYSSSLPLFGRRRHRHPVINC